MSRASKRHRSGGRGQRREGDVLGGASPTARSIKAWLTEQGSYSYRPQPDTIQVVEDPQVDGTFAVRFTDNARDFPVVDLLFVTGHEEGSVAEQLEATLEEVEFSSWPPMSGALRFF